jgi:hypothetical protein
MRRQFDNQHTFSALALATMLSLSLLIGTPNQGSANDSTAVVTGFVSDQNNHPLDGARVFLRAVDSPVSIRSVNRNGFFAFLAVLPGEYVVESTKNGYDTCSSAFTIYPNQTKSVHFRMSNEIRTISRVITTSGSWNSKTLGHVTTSSEYWNRCYYREPASLVSF